MLKRILPKSEVIEAFLEMYFTSGNYDMFSSSLDQNFDARIRLVQQPHAMYQSIHITCTLMTQITTSCHVSEHPYHLYVDDTNNNCQSTAEVLTFAHTGIRNAVIADPTRDYLQICHIRHKEQSNNGD